MADEMLRLELQRDLDRFEKAGMNDHAKKVKARLAELDEPEPEPKKAGKTAATKDVEEK